MKIEREELINQLETHCKHRYPREFGKKFKQGFHRNERVDDAEKLYNDCRFFDFEDCYCSVFSFKEWHDEAELRKQHAVIDCLVFDFDSEDPKIAFQDAKRLIEWLFSRNITPRVYFSGAKGFHVYIDFKPVELINPSEVIRRLGIRIKERLKLQTADTQVFELNRVMRVPFTINTKTGYKCTPIRADKFVKLDFDSILNFCKFSYSPIEFEEVDLSRVLKYEDHKLLTHKAIMEIIRLRPHRPKNKAKKAWLEKRINEYIEALRKYGRLTEDKTIAERHKAEHKARVHFCCLLIEAGYSDEEIEEIFRLCDDYDPKITGYHIRYTREWLKKKQTKTIVN